jgi:hypothetical protein
VAKKCKSEHKLGQNKNKINKIPSGSEKATSVVVSVTLCPNAVKELQIII